MLELQFVGLVVSQQVVSQQSSLTGQFFAMGVLLLLGVGKNHRRAGHPSIRGEGSSSSPSLEERLETVLVTRD